MSFPDRRHRPTSHSSVLVAALALLGARAPAAAPAYEIVHATYLGGSGDDLVRSLALGPGGEVHLVGKTDSDDFPVTAGALQATRGGGMDAFLVKLAPPPETGALRIAPPDGPASEDGEAPGRVLPVGLARIDITPQTPVQMYGYASRTTESEGIAGRLHARALAIGSDGGEGPAVLLAVDCGAVPPDVRSEVLERVGGEDELEDARLVLTNTHCHSGPNLKALGRLRGEEREHMERYRAELVAKLARVVREALATRRPSRLSWSRGRVDFAANRRVLEDGKWTGFGAVPGAPVEHELPVLRIETEDGRLRGALVNYACHATTLRGNFRRIHGDWASCAAQGIEAAHAGIVALVTIGCGADADPCPHGTVELAEQHGRKVATEVARLLAGEATPLASRLTVRRTLVEVAPPAPSPPAEVAGSQEARSAPEPIEYPISCWSFGEDLAMVFLMGEVVVDYDRRLRRELDGKRLWITAYSQDVPGYVVSRRLIGEGGYEVRSSLTYRLTRGRPETLAPAMEDRIVEAVRTLVPGAFHRSERGAASGPGAAE